MFEIKDTDHEGNPANEGRCFVTNGKDSFHVDRTGAERLCDLLNPKSEKAAPKK